MPAGIGDIATTSFITLYCHALETLSDEPILSDPKSVEVAASLNKTLATSDKPLDRILVAGKLDKRLVVHIAIRAKRYDDYARDFLKRSPDGVIVNIGCGLDSRFQRIDNGHVIFYDLDLPEVIAIKKGFFTETERYRFIASSVLDFTWMETVRNHPSSFLFNAEGVFMYLNKEDVRSLVLAIRGTFPGSQLVCEVVNSLWLSPFLKPLLDFKLQREAHWAKTQRSGPVFAMARRWKRGITGSGSSMNGAISIPVKRNWADSGSFGISRGSGRPSGRYDTGWSEQRGMQLASPPAS